MPTSTAIQRRLKTFPTTLLLWAGITVLMPILAVAAVVVDIVRGLATKKPWMTVRLVAFGWVYLTSQVAVIVISGLQWAASLPLGSRAADRRREWTYWLQRWWVRSLMAAMGGVLGTRLEVLDTDIITPAPIILLFRHASIMDNLLPYATVTDIAGVRLRWVLKKELLSDPALDIGGHRTPNYFVDRDSDSPETERSRIAALAADLGPNDGVMIFPEGTRYSRRKFEERMTRLETSRPDLHEIMAGHDLVLPPRSGGVVALLDSGCDVVLAAHTGLEDLRGIGNIWSNAAVGRTVRVAFRRVDASSIPQESDARVVWLHEQWAKVDDMVRSLRAIAKD